MVVNGDRRSRAASSGSPRGRDDRRRGAARGRPRTAAARSAGRRSPPTSHLPRNERRASTIASGSPSADREREADRRRRPGSGRGHRGRPATAPATPQRPIEDRPRRRGRATGSAEEQAEERGEGRRARHPTDRGRCGRSGPAPRPASDAVTTPAAGTRDAARTACPSGPASQVEERRPPRPAFVDAFDDDAGIRRGHVRRRRHLDRLDLVDAFASVT